MKYLQKLLLHSLNFFSNLNQSINFNQFISVRPEYSEHWTGHQGKLQPLLTDVHKNNVSKSNKRQYLREKIHVYTKQY